MGKKAKSEPKTEVAPPTSTSSQAAPPKANKTPRITRTWLRNITKANLALLLLLYILVVHLTGLFVFTRGFLLSRTSIPTTSPAYESGPPIAPTHSKAVILIIDALRTDFISPNYPSPKSPNHHGILTLPAELTAQHPSHSLIFNTYSDPPTTTMQRLKGLTTGSLPTFIDAGSNFASTAIEEDSIVSQLVGAEKKVVFMGDDTWLNLFPTSFAHAHPYDSFNVEDLHTVDNGVIEHLFPYLEAENATKWDVLVGHFLGVDHVGHRVGPERDTMKDKLTQMDQVLRKVVDRLEEDTLLVVLGDHGMDPKGNHGGDSDLETAAALWMYSKGSAISSTLVNQTVSDAWPTYVYPGSSTPIRHLNQIDLVPTLSLLLGLPIPFNNLGSVIPECFGDERELELATRENANQILRYLEEYGDQAILDDLIPARAGKNAAYARQAVHRENARAHSQNMKTDAERWNVQDQENKYREARRDSIKSHREFNLAALEKLRSLWAQFSVPLITLGSVILGLSVTTLLAFYTGIRNNGPNWDIFVRLAIDTAVLPASAIGLLAGVITLPFRPTLAPLSLVVGFVLTSEVLFSLPVVFQISRPKVESWPLVRFVGPFVLALHAISFASNSYIMWEDKVVVYLANTIAVIYLVKAMTAPTADMRIKLLGCSIGMIAVTRLIGAITVCREEQQPYCRVTFYSGSTPTASPYALAGIVLIAMHLPRALGVTLSQSKSLAGPAPKILGVSWRAAMFLSAVYWILEWMESWDGLQPRAIPVVHLIRLWIARIDFGIILFLLPYQWVTAALCIKVERDPDQTGDQSAVTVFGFANAYGSTYILFLLVPFALIHLISQPMAQVALAGMMLVVLLHIELVDTQRDAILLKRSFASSSNPGAFDGGPSTALVRPTFTDIVPLILLGHVGFFATGHQAVLTTIQWKAAFVGFNTVTYPFSPLLVILNTWGPFAISALALPLLAIWNVSPRPQGSVPVLAHTLQVALAGMMYHTITTLASAVFAAHLRRHLMVWKVFAPRFMLGGVTLLVVDLSLIVGVSIGMRMTSWKVWKTFKCLAV